MKILKTAIAISLATGCTLAPLQAADVQIVAQNPVVELSVSEQINSAPDTARFSTGVESKARTATQALRLNSGKVRTLINQIKAMGIEAKDIQTSGINLNANYQYNRSTRQNDFVGYRVSNQVSVIVRDLDKLGEILDRIVSVGGATNMNGPYFSIDDDNEIKKLAREKALKRAEQQAMVYAEAEGYSGVRILSIGEGLRNSSIAPPPVMRQVSMDAVANESVPIAPGQVGTTITLEITYEMTR